MGILRAWGFAIRAKGLGFSRFGVKGIGFNIYTARPRLSLWVAHTCLPYAHTCITESGTGTHLTVCQGHKTENDRFWVRKQNIHPTPVNQVSNL
jgi:hypothetical protein